MILSNRLVMFRDNLYNALENLICGHEEYEIREEEILNLLIETTSNIVNLTNSRRKNNE